MGSGNINTRRLSDYMTTQNTPPPFRLKSRLLNRAMGLEDEAKPERGYGGRGENRDPDESRDLPVKPKRKRAPGGGRPRFDPVTCRACGRDLPRKEFKTFEYGPKRGCLKSRICSYCREPAAQFVCADCGLTKPRSAFFELPGNQRSKYRVCPVCKPCSVKASRERLRREQEAEADEEE